ncbi:MAG: hypothetical protein KKF48_02585 [Nanoarchaeota archaeon]|nr:hypothetical protein [Nanoarchaeota archaeon]MBU1027908.1 hypothetical protein [Nanoarchaeota archaeon]
MKKKTKKYLSYWVVTFVMITASWFVWKTWDKVDMLIGQGNTAYLIAGGIILVAIIFGIGHFSFKKLVEKFK